MSENVNIFKRESVHNFQKIRSLFAGENFEFSTLKKKKKIKKKKKKTKDTKKLS